MWCFGLSATFGDRAGFMAEGDDKEKVSVLMSLQELINIRKGIGYSGAELQTFVRDQQDRQEERQLEGELEEVEGRRKPPRIPMPKFDHDSSQDVSHFLEVFEKVAKQCGYPESSWSLAYRMAVAGTKLEHIAAYGETYNDIKKEVSLAHGHTAEQLWRQLTNVKQGDESLRRLFWRTITKLGQFFKIAVKAESLSVDLVLDTLVKYMVLEGCSDELKEHFLEKTLSS